MNEENLEANSVNELKSIAKNRGIKLRSGIKKAEIVNAIKLDMLSSSIETKKDNISAEKKTEKTEVATEHKIKPERKVIVYKKKEEKAIEQVSKEISETLKEKEEQSGEQKEEQNSQILNNTNQNKTIVEGVLDIHPDGYGFLRSENYISKSDDAFVPPNFIKNYRLKTGDKIRGFCRPQKETDKRNNLAYIELVNDEPLFKLKGRKPFEDLIPIYPDEKYKLEKDKNEVSTRIIDLFAPIGKGQRGLIVSPPKAGKTILLKEIANSIAKNYPESKLIVLLIDERPEEVTDMRESVKGEVISSTFDEIPERHIKVAELVYERAQRLVEQGKDVVILLDSITRLARAYNLTVTPSGRTLSGGLDPGALYKPKKFFGAARNIRDGGSLTIIATALIDTGSKMDDVIFEEFKGTGNMELNLDRTLADKRVFPAINITKSGTRKEELLLDERELSVEYVIRKKYAELSSAEFTSSIINVIKKYDTNDEFVKKIKIETQN